MIGTVKHTVGHMDVRVIQIIQVQPAAIKSQGTKMMQHSMIVKGEATIGATLPTKNDGVGVQNKEIIVITIT